MEQREVPAETYVVEPQGLFLDELRGVLTRAGLNVIAVSPDLDLDAMMRAQPKVVFIDPDFSGVDVLEAAGAARACLPRGTICLYTARSRPALGSACVDAGADCVISKASTEEEIISALHAVLRGGHFVDPRVDRERRTRPRPAPADARRRRPERLFEERRGA